MNYDEVKEVLERAVIELTLDSIGRAIAEVTDDAGAREIIRGIQRNSNVDAV